MKLFDLNAVDDYRKIFQLFNRYRNIVLVRNESFYNFVQFFDDFHVLDARLWKVSLLDLGVLENQVGAQVPKPPTRVASKSSQIQRRQNPPRKQHRRSRSVLVTPNDGSIPDVGKQIELNLDDDVGSWVASIKKLKMDLKTQ